MNIYNTNEKLGAYNQKLIYIRGRGGGLFAGEVIIRVLQHVV